MVFNDDEAGETCNPKDAGAGKLKAGFELAHRCGRLRPAPQDSSARLIRYRASSCWTTATTVSRSSTCAIRSRSRNVPSQPQISSRLSIPGPQGAKDGKGA